MERLAEPILKPSTSPISGTLNLATDNPRTPTQQLRTHTLRTRQRMLSGRELDLITPSPLDVEITDIARGLARASRWNGQTVGEHAWSVAQHSLLVVEILKRQRPALRPSVLLYGLLHDAPEYVTQDLISPLKAAVGDIFKEIEDRLACAIHTCFGLPPRPSVAIKTLIKQADQVAAATEAVALAGFTVAEVSKVLTIKAKPLGDVCLTAVTSGEAERQFFAAFAQLDLAFRLERGL